MFLCWLQVRHYTEIKLDGIKYTALFSREKLCKASELATDKVSMLFLFHSVQYCKLPAYFKKKKVWIIIILGDLSEACYWTSQHVITVVNSSKYSQTAFQQEDSLTALL